jgi:hypothetical protein
MKIKHKASNGRDYTIETYSVAGGRLVKVRLSSGEWSQKVDLTWGMANHHAAAAHAIKVAEDHAIAA